MIVTRSSQSQAVSRRLAICLCAIGLPGSVLPTFTLVACDTLHYTFTTVCILNELRKGTKTHSEHFGMATPRGNVFGPPSIPFSTVSNFIPSLHIESLALASINWPTTSWVPVEMLPHVVSSSEETLAEYYSRGDRRSRRSINCRSRDCESVVVGRGMAE